MHRRTKSGRHPNGMKRIRDETTLAVLGNLRSMPDLHQSLEAASTDPRPRTPEELVLHRLRMVGLGLLVAAVAFDGLQGPLKRWRALRARVVTGVNPLDPPGSMFVAGVADFLTSLDGSARGRGTTARYTRVRHGGRGSLP